MGEKEEDRLLWEDFYTYFIKTWVTGTYKPKLWNVFHILTANYMQFFLQFIKTTNSISKALILKFPANNIKSFCKKNTLNSPKKILKILQNHFQNSPKISKTLQKTYQDSPKKIRISQNSPIISKKNSQNPKNFPGLPKKLPKFSRISQNSPNFGVTTILESFINRNSISRISQNFFPKFSKILQNSPKFPKFSKKTLENPGFWRILDAKKECRSCYGREPCSV